MTAALRADAAVDNVSSYEVELAALFVVVAGILAPSVMAPLAWSTLLVKAALDAEAALIVTGSNSAQALESADRRVAIRLVEARQAIAIVTDLAVLAIAVTLVATVCAGDSVMLLVDAALLADAFAETAIHEVKAFGVVTAAFAAGPQLAFLVDAALQPQLLGAWREADSVQAAYLAYRALDISAARFLAVRDTVNAATAPARFAAQRFTRNPAFLTLQGWSGSVSRRALLSHFSQACRSCVSGSIGWRISGRSRSRFFNDWSGSCFLNDRSRSGFLYGRSRSGFLGYFGRLIHNPFFGILGGDFANAAERGAADKSAEQPFQQPPPGGSLRHRARQRVKPFVVHAFLLFRCHPGFRQQARV
jgi:hypothetical protein